MMRAQSACIHCITRKAVGLGRSWYGRLAAHMKVYHQMKPKSVRAKSSHGLFPVPRRFLIR